MTTALNSMNLLGNTVLNREKLRKTRLFCRRHVELDAIKSAGSFFCYQLTLQTMEVTKQNYLFKG